MSFHPKFITFDCYGTLTNFDMAGAAKDLYGAKLSAAQIDQFIADFSSYRRDEILGNWKPYADVVSRSLERTCKKHGLPFEQGKADEIYARVPTWGSHPDVPDGLKAVSDRFPLVILSNSMRELIHHNVEKLGAPFAHVFTAEDAGAYKPQFRAFEYMLGALGCGPEDCLHVSSSFRYDLMTATDLGFGGKVWVNRGHEPAAPGYGYTEIADIGELPGVLGL
ncbi:MAG: haloacid dehalogenase type II [Pseudomonadota bacterium]